MQLYEEPIINTHTYNEILDEINQPREIFDPVIIGGTATDLGTVKAFVFTVAGTLTDGTFSAPTLEATGTEKVNELKAFFISKKVTVKLYDLWSDSKIEN